MQVTSLIAYDSIKKTLGNKQKIVLEAIFKLGEATNRDIKNFLGWDINSITPRVKELREMKLVTEAKTDNDKTTGRMSIYWRVSRPEDDLIKIIKI